MRVSGLKMKYSRTLLPGLLFAAGLFAPGQYACAQTAAQIESTIKKSKYIDNTRPVRAAVKNGEVSISTYSHPKASDKDCKINALLIMKELLQKFKTVHRLHISFYDPKDPSSYRTAEVADVDAKLVESGRPVEDVLAQVPLSRGNLNAKPTKNTTSFLGIDLETLSDTKDLKYFSTSDGDITIALPQGALTLENPEPDCMVRCVNVLIVIEVWRQDMAKTTFDQAVSIMTSGAYDRMPGFKLTKGQDVTFKGARAKYLEGTFSPGKKSRGIIIQGRKHIYTLAIQGPLTHENQIRTLYQQLVSSLNIRG